MKGGKVYGNGGAQGDQLYEGRDLALTTDFRDVFAEVAKQHMGARDVNSIFPATRSTLESSKDDLGVRRLVAAEGSRTQNIRLLLPIAAVLNRKGDKSPLNYPAGWLSAGRV